MLLHEKSGEALVEMFRVLKVGEVQAGRGFILGFEKTFQKGAGENRKPILARAA